jgi:tetratricopeptide (TPR) repeat protein
MNELIERYTQLAAQHPQNELVRFSLGKAFFDAQQYEAARDQFSQAVARKPNWMAAQILLGKCELNLGHRAAAKAVFEVARALALQQKHAGPLAETAQLLAQVAGEPA